MKSYTDLLDRYNTKILLYPNGSTKRVFCNKHIFSYPEDKKILNVSGKRPKKLESNLLKYAVDNYYHKVSAEQPETVEIKQQRKDSVLRAKNKLFDLVFCNEWDLFVTITFNPDEVDSFNAKAVIKKLKVWLSNMVERKGLKYVLVPELHKSKRIHCHLLCNDVFRMVDSGKKSNGRKVFNLPEWKFGFSTAIYTYGDRMNLSCYITKYITKGNDSVFGRFYWSSKNIVRTPEIVLTNSDFFDLDYPEYQFKKLDLLFKYENLSFVKK